MSNPIILFWVSLFLSYLLGSIPSAYIFVRIIKKQDIRKLGSGNVGATNAMRVLGKKWGILILAIDMLKGFIPTIFIADYILFKFKYPSAELLRLLMGFSAVIGHNWPVFLNFKGGKGVATTFGVMLALTLKINGFIWVVLSSLGIWITVFSISKIVSVASIVSAITLPIFMLIFKQNIYLIFISIIFSSLILIRHLPNIQRLRQGKELRI
jgi:glycerol-3-phosphate acyltransferase PlsY